MAKKKKKKVTTAVSTATLDRSQSNATSYFNGVYYEPKSAVQKKKTDARTVTSLIEQRDGYDSPKSRMFKYEKGTREYNDAVAEYNKLTLDIRAVNPEAGGELIDTNTPFYDPNDKMGNVVNNLGLVIDTDANGNSVVRSDATRSTSTDYKGGGQEHFLYITKNKKAITHPKQTDKQNIGVNVGYSYNEFERKVLEDASLSEGGVKGLLEKMFKAGVITKDTYNKQLLSSNDFSSGLQYAAREYSKQVVRDYQVNGIKDPISFNDYLINGLQKQKSNVTYDSHFTTRDTAASDLNRFFKDWLGRGATKEEHDQYYNMLRTAEGKAIKTTVIDGKSQSVTGEFIDSLDVLEMQRKVAGKALRGTDIDTVLASGAAGAQSVNDVMSYAADYGVQLTSSEALKYVADSLKNNQGDTKLVRAKMLDISKSMYSNIADSITDNVSLKELSNNYRYEMAKTLEVNYDALDANDPLIQTALRNNGNKGMMSLTDFNKMLRQDSRWASTTNAREEASKYALNVLQSFGLIS